MRHLCIKHSPGFRQTLRQSGLKVTPARLLVLDRLLHAKTPLSAADMLDKAGAGSVDIATIYRTLETLVKYGMVSVVRITSDKLLYELSGAHHHHVTCNNCGKIADLDACNVALIEKLALKETGFGKLSGHSLEFFGTCKACL